ncbi:hypothetical protein R50073_26340 [Maricurvus nonylphenolicus]|uniref:DUF1145 domain-containing protein n=1 Tax=Maricurvus nonylphenolicus TaxID=1008307 RepID=UPI0036F2C070
MSPLKIKVGKAVVSVVWVMVIASLLIPDVMPFSEVFIGVGIFITVVHILQVVVYGKRFTAPSDYLYTIIFGMLHLETLSEKSR